MRKEIQIIQHKEEIPNEKNRSILDHMKNHLNLVADRSDRYQIIKNDHLNLPFVSYKAVFFSEIKPPLNSKNL